jgi:hypothetical protein
MKIKEVIDTTVTLRNRYQTAMHGLVPARGAQDDNEINHAVPQTRFVYHST